MYLLISFFMLLFTGGYVTSIFNRFARWRNKVKDAWSNIDVALKRRHDLIPNLISTVKGYTLHEQETLNSVVEARAAAMKVPGSDLRGQMQAENRLQQALGSLIAISESYPDLKASEPFTRLQQELSHLEENLERSRRYYNSMVRENNSYGETFPARLFAGPFLFKHFDYYQAPTEDRENVTVDFTTSATQAKNG
jgi:LemA protein